MALSSPRLLPFLAMAAALGSCAEPDPSYGDPGGILGKRVPNESATGTGSSSGATEFAPFAAAYSGTANAPSKTLVASHAAAASKGAPTAISGPLVCGDCHKEGGLAGAKVFAYGGRVMKGTNGVPNVDVMVVGSTPADFVKTDADGFFWLIGTPISGGKAAIRTAAGKSEMSSTPAVSCDTTGCHQDAAQGRIGKNLP